MRVRPDFEIGGPKYNDCHRRYICHRARRFTTMTEACIYRLHYLNVYIIIWYYTGWSTNYIFTSVLSLDNAFFQIWIFGNFKNVQIFWIFFTT